MANLLLAMTLVVLLLLFIASYFTPKVSNISYSFFREQVESGNVVKVVVEQQQLLGRFKSAPDKPPYLDSNGELKTDEEKLAIDFRVELLDDQKDVGPLLDKHTVAYEFRRTQNPVYYLYALMFLLPLGLVLYMWLSFRRSRDQIMGGGFLSGFTKSPAKRYESSKQGVTFDDVAGLAGVKADLLEIVDFLKNPAKFQALGGRVPKGVLLNGPPGTGKTLLARAVAGEAGVPFFSVNGSEFIQMFVGVGASRVRDLFKNAKDQSPAIIFIDEIDAVGRQRGAGLGGGHDEREQTLNQILSEMDGFAQTDSVIVVGATNRPDVLDPALLRPGRFDRHVTVGRPTHKGRIDIFKVHVRDVPLADDVDLNLLASKTVGLTGADIRNVVNEAALWAARHDKKIVEMEDFDYARDKILMGAKREEVLVQKEKEKTAYHEAGHTLAAWSLPGADRVDKVTIIPRGRALGATHTLPPEDRMSMAESELRDQLVMLLAGRAAELLVYEETTVGAGERPRTRHRAGPPDGDALGMSSRLGPVSYKMSDDDPFLGRELHQQRQFSENTMELIDQEVSQILRSAADQAYELLQNRRQDLESLSQALLEQEELTTDEITQRIGASAQSARGTDSDPSTEQGRTSATGSASVSPKLGDST